MLKITEVRNAKYTNEDGWIDCEIRHDELEGGDWIPYHINPKEDHPFIDMVTLTSSAKATNPTPYNKPTEEEVKKQLSVEVRRNRDILLQNDVDPYVMNFMRWDEQSEDKQNKIKNYRQKLLDVPQQEGFPNSITWPTKDF